VASLAARGETPAALTARAKLDLDAKDLRFDRPQRMAVARPARLRVEVLGLFDQLAAVVVTNGDLYQVYDARSNDLEEGVVDAHLLWRVARVDLEPAEAVDLMLGTPRPDPTLQVGPARAYPNGEIGLERVDGDGVLREGYRFDAASRVLEAMVYDPSGGLVWRAEFGDYRSIDAPGGGQLPFAHDVLLEFPRVEARARLTFKRVTLASELPDTLFALRLPGRSSAARDVGRGNGLSRETGARATR
jgi:hypothetical protein